MFPIIARGDLFAPIIAMRCAEADAVDRAQRLLQGEGDVPLWRRLSNAMFRNARRMRLYWVLRAHLSTMPGAGVAAGVDLNEVIAGHARTLHRLASERMMEKAAAAEVARRTSSSGAASGSTTRCGVNDYLRGQIDRCPCAGQEAGLALRHAKRPKTGCKKAATNLEAAPG